jgi:hypothetical protein
MSFPFLPDSLSLRRGTFAVISPGTDVEVRHVVSTKVIGMTAATVDVANEIGVILEGEVKCGSILRMIEHVVE